MQAHKHIGAALRRLSSHLIDGFLLPRSCPVCGCILEPHEEALCLRCLLRLPLCSLSGPELFDNRAMALNAAGSPGIARAWFGYDPASDYASLIKEMKYNGRPRLGTELGRLFAKDLLREPTQAGSIGPADIDVLLPMPMHIFKRLRRGFNQSEAIAHGIAEITGAAVADNLVAVRGHSTQTHLSAKQRADNLSGTFTLLHGDELEGLNVAVVDDIITTGASASEAFLAISRGAPSVASISFLALGATVKK
ncbi:MAG: hypothetical protein NC418_01275 [Muribaculaceae bacterium]|nr:hypothetical protein [Muribaculaceae bacterium]